ncbi:glycosyl hydrolase family 71-domain-containing protein [Kockovaella imperatae]|uniref:Glycosyl hydrolase family 71-domain-containing protein n=1 Tax=Kockovaella imperatae TaxID=4999 RepID=A0A1Y1U9D4_9TREE|nr:glycosyl hydrolase family 71-domain-containing protein [Kockovaella imperatae]ORX34643.1 glycosyl hydrolase family 71-domain-containing protein [Kockovaella imperatae]
MVHISPSASLVWLLAATAGVSEAKPFLPPGHHAPPNIANLLSASKRSVQNLIGRFYYGTEWGLTKPPPLPSKRDSSLPVGWEYYGCLTESKGQRLLQGFAFSSMSMSTDMCLNQCAKMGYKFGGTEAGDECFCGNEFLGSGGQVTGDGYCTELCFGESSATCGANWLLSMYSFNASAIPGCLPGYGVGPGIHETSGLPNITGNTVSSTSLMPTASVSISLTSTSIGTGVISTGTGVISTGTGVISTGTGVISTGTGVMSTSSVSMTGSTTSSPSPTSTLPTHEDQEDSSEWYVLGCAVDSATRILTGASKLTEQALTVDDCLTWCEDQGFSFAGVEYGAQCFCGNSVPTAITYNDTLCSMPCTGDATEMCGGEWGLDLFELVKGSSGCAAPTSSAGTTGTTSGVFIVKPTSAAGSGGASASPTASSTTSSPSSTSTQPSSTPDDHQVFAHFMVGNTYPYDQSKWAADVAAAAAQGIDGFALNMGSDSWQPPQVTNAYAAAEAAGNFKLFLSLDMTSLSCSSASDAQDLVNLVKTYASSSAQAKFEGQVLVSTFAGSDCTFGSGSSNAWQTQFVDALTQDGVDIFFVPSIFSDPSTFASTSWLDGELNWNSGWPMGGQDLTTASDVQYMSALGSKAYMPAISPFFFTHFGANSWNKNWLYRSDDWLYATRWEQVISMRSQVKMTEILTWNDYGESSYIGPIDGALPANSGQWVNGFDHTVLSTLTQYYSTAFKTGSYPDITKDQVLLWQRPHAADANCPNDPAGKPAGTENTDDNLYAIALMTAPGSVTLTAGSTSQTFQVPAGLNKLKIPSAPGAMGGSISRGGQVVASVESTGFDWTLTPELYNYNYFAISS